MTAGLAAATGLLTALLVVVARRGARWRGVAAPRRPIAEWREPVTGGATLLLREWHDAGDRPRTEPRPVPERRVEEDGIIFTGDWE